MDQPESLKFHFFQILITLFLKVKGSLRGQRKIAKLTHFLNMIAEFAFLFGGLEGYQQLAIYIRTFNETSYLVHRDNQQQQLSPLHHLCSNIPRLYYMPSQI